ncbi:hypothetical protein Tco_0824967 [Tanacetum coccineum]
MVRLSLRLPASYLEITYQPRRRVMILSHGQPIPYSQLYRYHPYGLIHMMPARKRVGLFLVPQLAVGHPVDHSSSDYFSPDDLARDSSSYSSSEASSDFHSDASSDSSLRHSLSDHSSPDLPSTSTGPSPKRRRSPTTSVPALSPVSRALSPVRADLIPSPKRVKDSGYLTDQDIDPEIQAEINECIAYADALRDRGIDARVVVEAVDRDETETGMRGLVEVRVERVTHPAMPEDIPEPVQEGEVEAIEGVQREQGHRIVAVESAVTALTERVAELEKDNRRLRGTCLTERCLHTNRASMTHEEVEELVNCRVAEEMEACEAAMNLKPMNENGKIEKVEIEGTEEWKRKNGGKMEIMETRKTEMEEMDTGMETMA